MPVRFYRTGIFNLYSIFSEIYYKLQLEFIVYFGIFLEKTFGEKAGMIYSTDLQ